MIEFFSENDFSLLNQKDVQNWIHTVITTEGYVLGDVSYVFCDDAYLLDLNQRFLQHDTLTDIISFDAVMGKEVHGEIYISTERVLENSEIYKVSFQDELHRVIVHGALHFCGYKDKTDDEASLMRLKEDSYLNSREFV